MLREMEARQRQTIRIGKSLPAHYTRTLSKIDHSCILELNNDKYLNILDGLFLSTYKRYFA